jgi:hypothetical protein
MPPAPQFPIEKQETSLVREFGPTFNPSASGIAVDPVGKGPAVDEAPAVEIPKTIQMATTMTTSDLEVFIS